MRLSRIAALLLAIGAVVGVAPTASATDNECYEHEYEPQAVEIAYDDYEDKCVTPEAPTAESPTCENLLGGKIVIPGDGEDGVRYKLDYEPVDSGEHAVPPGTYHVKAYPARGYDFPEDAVTHWELVVEEPGNCTGPPGVPGTPGTPGAPGAPGVPGQVVVVQTQAPAAPAVVGRPTVTG